MPITTSVPSSTRKPGAYVEFDTVSGQRGLVPIQRRVALIGAKIAAGTATAELPQRVTSRKESETYFGKGSELDLMVKQALKTAARYGSSPEIYGVPVADPGGGVKAARTFTVTGPATESGDIELKVAGRLIRVGVTDDDAQNTIAANIEKELDAAVADLPVTAAVNTNVVTVTAANAGVNGNAIVCEVVKAPAGVSIAVANSVAGSGSYDITAALDSLVDQHYHSVAAANHLAGDLTDAAAWLDVVGGAGAKKWAFFFIGETGSLATATALASGSNRKDTHVITAEDFRSLPGEIATAVATRLEGQEDPALHLDGRELDLYLPDADAVPTNAEIETAIAGGCTILTVNAQKTMASIVRLCTTKTSENSAPFWTLLDTPHVRTLYWAGVQVDAAVLRFMAIDENKKLDDDTMNRLRDVIYDVLKQGEALRYLHNVDAHAGELVVEVDAVVATRVNVGIPVSVIQGLHQVVGVSTLYIEAPIAAAA